MLTLLVEKIAGNYQHGNDPQPAHPSDALSGRGVNLIGRNAVEFG